MRNLVLFGADPWQHVVASLKLKDTEGVFNLLSTLASGFTTGEATEFLSVSEQDFEH